MAKTKVPGYGRKLQIGLLPKGAKFRFNYESELCYVVSCAEEDHPYVDWRPVEREQSYCTAYANEEVHVVEYEPVSLQIVLGTQSGFPTYYACNENEEVIDHIGVPPEIALQLMRECILFRVVMDKPDNELSYYRSQPSSLMLAPRSSPCCD